LEPAEKIRLPRQRACNQLNEKGKHCCGHLKRWYANPRETQAEVYRCERCHTVYLPNPAEEPRTGTLAW